MRFIKPSYDIWNPPHYFEGILEHIERAGRVCYKSEDRIKYDECGNSLTAKPFVDKLIESDHLSVLEHGTIYLMIPADRAYDASGNIWVIDNYGNSCYSAMNYNKQNYYITTNYRVLVENDWLDDLRYLCAPTEYHEKRVTVHFTLDRAISMEFLRHRKMSFTQESTRYCNYSNKDKFDNEITFIEPCWLEDYNYEDNTYNQIFIDSLRFAEAHYLDLLKKWDDKIPDKRYKTGFRNNPWTPQQARAVLPNALKTELVMTGFVDDWKKFFELRDSNKAHPQARELASPLHKEFIEKGLIK
jgi:thymidylate synthase (FAD)|nr:MAG TPA: Thymidylate synthase complementing protein [Herelleviridae sp.]